MDMDENQNYDNVERHTHTPYFLSNQSRNVT